MMWRNLQLAAFVFFAWLLADATLSLIGQPLEGVFYPLQHGSRLSHLTYDWSDKLWFVAPVYFILFGALWWIFIRQQGAFKGARIAALISAFVVAPFWIVTSLSADMYDFEINGYWVASMVYCNLSFFVYGFFGRGTIEDLNF